MAISDNLFSIYWIVWVSALMGLMGTMVWYGRPATRRDQAGLSIPLKQFTMQIKLTPDEVQRRLTGAVEPFVFLRTTFDYAGNYEGQWLTADLFELHRLSRKNGLFLYLELTPYLQKTTLVKVTQRIPTLALGPMVLFGLNPILIRLLTSGSFFSVFFCLPFLVFIMIAQVIYIFTLRHESAKARAFLEQLFGQSIVQMSG